MIKINDKIALGAVSGILTTFILDIVDYISVMLGINKWHMWQIAASAYFKVEDVDRVSALFVGAVTHLSLIAISGAVIVYILDFTGRDYYWLKGILVLMLFWTVVFGIILRTKVGRIDPIGVGTNLAHITGHITAGILMSWLIIRLAGDEVWN